METDGCSMFAPWEASVGILERYLLKAETLAK